MLDWKKFHSTSSFVPLAWQFGGLAAIGFIFRMHLKQLPRLFWHVFNPRMTFEGLIGQTNKAWKDGPRLAIMIDELSLVMAVSRGSNLSLDELLMFLDDDRECNKTAASIQRRLVDPCISAVLGCQWDCLHEVVAGPGAVERECVAYFMFYMFLVPTSIRRL